MNRTHGAASLGVPFNLFKDFISRAFVFWGFHCNTYKLQVFPFLVSLKLVPGFYLKDLSDGDSTVIHTSCRLSHSPSSLVFKCILFCIFCVSLFSNILQITLTNYPLQNVSFYTAELHSRAGTHTYCISVCMCKISG